MNYNKKSREGMIAEIAGLHRELDEMRSHEKQNPDAIAEGERCKTLVNEVPEYLYSIEFRDGKIGSIFHGSRCEEITGYTPGDYAKNSNLWVDGNDL